jgi:hypothetical protein
MRARHDRRGTRPKVIAGPAILVAAAAALVAPAAMAQDRPFLNRTSPGAERCDKLHAYVYRYNVESVSQHNTGRRFNADVALALCARGDFDQGIAMLEAEAQRAGLPPLPAN